MTAALEKKNKQVIIGKLDTRDCKMECHFLFLE